MAVALGVRAVAAIPVIMGGRPIGVVAVHRLQPPLFTPEQVANLWLLAAVVVAPLLELARLQRRVSEQEAHLQGVGLVCAANQPCPAHRREREVVPLLAAGRTNREIGAALHISPGSVRNVVRRLLAKLGARDRTHAVVLAITRGLLRRMA